MSGCNFSRLIVVFSALSVLAWAGCAETNTYVEPPPPEVTVARPVQQDVTTYLEATGTTAAFEHVEIRARVKGFLEEIKFGFGDDVEQGELLYVIDPKPFQAVLNQAVAAKGVAVAEFKDAKAKYDRALPLAKKGAMSEEELFERYAAQEVAYSGIQAAQAAIDEAQLNVDYTKVKSPINGRVGKSLVDVGNLVGDSTATHLTTVIRYAPVYANFNISEPELLEILATRDGKAKRDKEDVVILMQLSNETGYPHIGRLDYADLAVDASTGTFAIRGVFPNSDESVVPGLYVSIRIPKGTAEGALLLPEAAIGMDQLGRFVLTVNGENEVERKKVIVGTKVSGMLVVQDGITPEDRVVVSGIQRARPGAKVNPTDTKLEPPSEAEAVIREDLEPPVIEGDAPTAPLPEDADTDPAAETPTQPVPPSLPPSLAPPSDATKPAPGKDAPPAPGKDSAAEPKPAPATGANPESNANPSPAPPVTPTPSATAPTTNPAAPSPAPTTRPAS